MHSCGCTGRAMHTSAAWSSQSTQSPELQRGAETHQQPPLHQLPPPTMLSCDLTSNAIWEFDLEKHARHSATTALLLRGRWGDVWNCCTCSRRGIHVRVSDPSRNTYSTEMVTLRDMRGFLHWTHGGATLFHQHCWWHYGSNCETSARYQRIFFHT